MLIVTNCLYLRNSLGFIIDKLKVKHQIPSDIFLVVDVRGVNLIDLERKFNKRKYIYVVNCPDYQTPEWAYRYSVNLALSVNDFTSVLLKVTRGLIQEIKGSMEGFSTQQRPELALKEKQTLYLLLKGFSVREISRMLDLSEKTIYGYIKTIRQNLLVKNTAELSLLTMKLTPSSP